MNYLAVLISTRWGSSLGGINVFNTGLATAVAEVLHAQGQCVCFLEQEAISLAPDNIVFRTFTGDTNAAAANITETLVAEFAALHAADVVVIGHDVKTGRIAIDCVKSLKSAGLARVRAVTVSHMDYIQYATYKGHPPNRVNERFTEQREIVADADVAFAVGPLLQQSFQVARSSGQGRSSRVEMLVPGTPNFDPCKEDESPQLRVFISGRLGGDDDFIKNGKLAILSLTDAYEHGLRDASKSWKKRGALYAFGLDADTDNKELAEVKKAANAHFNIVPVPYTDDQSTIFEHLRNSHIAMMPSWHEGFGLSGWEALSLGVPLICSAQSGLAQLLETLRDTNPQLDLESVNFVDLVGVNDNGEASSQDREELRRALLDVARHYSRKKASALRLAAYLKTEFTWERCAGELLGRLGWILPKSVGWMDRQQVAASNDEARSPAKEKALIDDAMERATQGDGFVDWENVCSALNVFSNLGKTAQLGERRSLFQKLEKLALCLIATLKQESTTQVLPIRISGKMDVLWRLMAATASTARSFSQFNSVIGGPLLNEILSESFLRREYFYYACKFSSEFENGAQELARHTFEAIRAYADDKGLQRRLARLVTIHPSLLSVIPEENCNDAFKSEYETCSEIESASWHATSLIETRPSFAPSLLAVGSLKSARHSQNIEHVLALVQDYGGTLAKPQWRGDKRLKTALLAAGINSEALIGVLRALASDEEEAVRWAAVDIVFSPLVRRRLVEIVSSEKFEKTRKSVLSVLGEIVDIAVGSDESHPWLQREFVNLYSKERSRKTEFSADLLFSLDDFPRSRWLLGPPPIALESTRVRLHPEVLLARARSRLTIKRILLVLPPIDIAHAPDASGGLNTTTPPLGLGMLASHLATLGHDVHIADCHRFPELSAKLVEAARYFDIVGFNVVISTVRSVLHMATQIKKLPFSPMVVVGGPAVNLGSWSYAGTTPDESSCWDFAISGDAERNLAILVSALSTVEPWPAIPGLTPNEDSPMVYAKGVSEEKTQTTESDVNLFAKEWRPLNPLDRRVFRGPEGYFEPNSTRAKELGFHEAHVVMSKGCDWECTFCTERRQLSNGERRRSVSDVAAELRELSLTYSSLRIQFVDDNFFPQIASPHNNAPAKRQYCLDWATNFLKALAEVSEKLENSFGWRGIFRIEDFLEYENTFGSAKFIEALKASGCRMLAFGVEHGNEKKRLRLKVSRGISNDAIAALFLRLKQNGIHTKAYFMLGGWNETIDDMTETINFAIAAGPTLAYFALFKQFVPAVSALKKQEVPGEHQHEKFLAYKQHRPNWDGLVSASGADLTSTELSEVFATFIGTSFPEAQALSASHCLAQLSRLGFSFRDLVKYNDYHADEGPSASVLRELTGGSQDTYFSLVNEAYLRFYLRTEFVENYKTLISDGY